MKTLSNTSESEELGFFYDNIHGRISLDELPSAFHAALKAALSSPALDRLKRISQLGHTSLSYFSATHTRFSHALGSMLVMNKLFLHVSRRKNGLSSALFTQVRNEYKKQIKSFGDTETFIHCPLLLAALYQDVGELPFQKVTSLYFRPACNAAEKLQNKLNSIANLTTWKAKDVFSMLALLEDKEKNDKLGVALSSYSLDFLAFLITGKGQPPNATQFGALRQLVDGGIDADRLDYVYRDAAVTIGSLSRPTTVLESIASYGVNHVIVSDPRPVVDFLSTRMRLWTFVYSAPDVRFRQALLKTFLQGRLDSAETEAQFKGGGLEP
jgi:HD superfamily phosphohydrolase